MSVGGTCRSMARRGDRRGLGRQVVVRHPFIANGARAHHDVPDATVWLESAGQAKAEEVPDAQSGELLDEDADHGSADPEIADQTYHPAAARQCVQRVLAHDGQLLRLLTLDQTGHGGPLIQHQHPRGWLESGQLAARAGVGQEALGGDQR